MIFEIQTEEEYHWASLELEKLKLTTNNNPLFERIKDFLFEICNEYELKTPQELKQIKRIDNYPTTKELIDKLGLIKPS